ncbi:MAG TPA: hypothetical protein VNO70_26590 [Blastocatellia bacterium]|nr:hypothetical protein [Blastocatellia bacterium]
MLKKIASILLAITVCAALSLQSVAAGTKAKEEVELAQKVRAGIAKLGVGENARVEVKLRDKTKLTGYVTEAGEDSFILADPKTGSVTTVAYPDVTQVKGHNLSTRTKVVIGVAIAVGVGILLYLVRGAFCDGQC